MSAPGSAERHARDVVVVGAGFAGFYAAHRLRARLRPDEATITEVSDTDGLFYQPLLPEITVGALDARTVSVPLATALSGVRFVRGYATGVDPEAETVTVNTGTSATGAGSRRTFRYDRLVLTPGGVTRLLDIPGLAEHAVGFKTVAEALYIREHVLLRLEQASNVTDPEARRRLLTFVVVGAGYAGTELVAQLSRTVARLITRLPGIDSTDVHWLLVDVANAVMPELGPKLGGLALDLIRARGVDVRLGVSVKEVDPDGATLTDGTRLDGATVVWCAGVAPSPLAEASGLPTTKGKITVQSDLSVTGYPGIFAAGDSASVPDLTSEPDSNGEHRPCPPTAQHAMRQGRALARNVVADLRGQPRRPYRHRDLGLVVDLGGADAVASPLGVPLHGWLAKAVTRGYHLYALPSPKRRARAVVDWILAGRFPDDVAFGLLNPPALANAEHRPPQLTASLSRRSPR